MQQQPIFLSKLYKMVEDPASRELIRWSADGKSFLVFRQQDLARDVLPRFFKHNNFSSFVRQLNMYGFHKRPHLMQGVMISDEPEWLEFVNENFQRDRLDLLPLMKRRTGGKAAHNSSNTITGETTALSASSSALPTMALLPDDTISAADLAGSSSALVGRGGVDFAAVARDINAMRQSQKLVVDEMRRMQLENQALWQANFAAQERHRQQQDTIDKILRFLASVFSSDKVKGLKKSQKNESSSSPSSPTTTASAAPAEPTRKRPRLMLEDGSAQDSEVNKEILDLLQSQQSPPAFDFATYPAPASSSLSSAYITDPSLTSAPGSISSDTDDLHTKLQNIDDKMLSVTGELGLSQADLDNLSSLDVDDFLDTYHTPSAFNGGDSYNNDSFEWLRQA